MLSQILLEYVSVIRSISKREKDRTGGRKSNEAYKVNGLERGVLRITAVVIEVV